MPIPCPKQHVLSPLRLHGVVRIAVCLTLDTLTNAPPKTPHEETAMRAIILLKIVIIGARHFRAFERKPLQTHTDFFLVIFSYCTSRDNSLMWENCLWEKSFYYYLCLIIKNKYKKVGIIHLTRPLNNEAVLGQISGSKFRSTIWDGRFAWFYVWIALCSSIMII